MLQRLRVSIQRLVSVTAVIEVDVSTDSLWARRRNDESTIQRRFRLWHREQPPGWSAAASHLSSGGGSLAYGGVVLRRDERVSGRTVLAAIGTNCSSVSRVPPSFDDYSASIR